MIYILYKIIGVMSFSMQDKEFMKIALKEAKKSLDRGDYPVGAVLVIDGKLISKGGNSIYSKKDWISHAENNLIKKCSPIIKNKCLPAIQNQTKDKVNVELFTTLEPCLMCLGSSILHKVSRIVFACPDPHGGATNINPKLLPYWYDMRWPSIESGLLKKESYNLLIKFMENRKEPFWKNVLKLYKNLDKNNGVLIKYKREVNNICQK